MHCFENAFHELFNETPEYATPVFDTLRDWLLARFCRAVLTQAFATKSASALYQKAQAAIFFIASLP